MASIAAALLRAERKKVPSVTEADLKLSLPMSEEGLANGEDAAETKAVAAARGAVLVKLVMVGDIAAYSTSVLDSIETDIATAAACASAQVTPIVTLSSLPPFEPCRRNQHVTPDLELLTD